MNNKKWAILFVVVMMVAVLAAGCGGGATTPTPDPEPPAVVGSTIPHALDDSYENCIGCHGSVIEESHVDFAGYEDSCLNCHEAE